jgi:hypothetical protein
MPSCSTMRPRWATGLVTLTLLFAHAPGPASAQGPPLAVEDMPLAQLGGAASGGTVTPVYEGWYANPDGTLTLYFGYYNRNTEEIVSVPAGPSNRIEGLAGGTDLGQPTVFYPGRHWGVFGVVVPPDFGSGTLLWHLEVRGKVFEIPGELREDWTVPAISGDAMDNHPPRLRLQEGGPEGFGPLGVWGGPWQARVGQPAPLEVWATDDGTATSGRPGARAQPMTLTWFVHRGPGTVRFDREQATVPNEGGLFATEVLFERPGEYVLRVRATDDSGLAPAGHEQCCWTNGFARFSVSP